MTQKVIVIFCINFFKSLDDAMAELQSIDDKSQRNGTLILQLMRENLILWKSDSGSNHNEESTQESDSDFEKKASSTALQQGSAPSTPGSKPIEKPDN